MCLIFFPKNYLQSLSELKCFTAVFIISNEYKTESIFSTIIMNYSTITFVILKYIFCWFSIVYSSFFFTFDISVTTQGGKSNEAYYAGIDEENNEL